MLAGDSYAVDEAIVKCNKMREKWVKMRSKMHQKWVEKWEI
jgi:hypothetical protein